MTDEALIERVARALCKSEGLDPDGDWTTNGVVQLGIALDDTRRWLTYRRAAQAAIDEVLASPPSSSGSVT